MAVHAGHPTRTPQTPVLTWLVVPALVALGAPRGLVTTTPRSARTGPRATQSS